MVEHLLKVAKSNFSLIVSREEVGLDYLIIIIPLAYGYPALPSSRSQQATKINCLKGCD